MTFDPVAYLMTKLDLALEANKKLAEEVHETRHRQSDHEKRISSLEQLRDLCLRLARLSLPILVLILAGLAALGPKQTVELIQALLKAAT